ncbi:MAG: hypothetical protein LAN37_14170 [Acidobacteriia bacterium]|nr:hypothetical protein [Terriglobia bacterium]
MNNIDVLGTNLSGSHPFSVVLPMKDSPDLVASLVSQGKTADPLQKVKLKSGNIECTSCHNPHVQGIDTVAQNFLVRDSSNGQMCLACHDPNRVVSGKVNPIAGWTGSIHATATNKVAGQAQVGSYGTVAQNACSSCHMSHNAQGPVRLLRAANPPAPTVDPTTQDCLTCHSGELNLSPSSPNIYAEFVKPGHPLPAGNNVHDAAETAVLSNNRHATCADCHNPHSANQVSSFTIPPAIRVSQAGVAGVSAADGVTVLTPAVNQYENCLRCHGTSAGKGTNPATFGYLPAYPNSAGDPLNVISQFGSTTLSSHPVMRDFSSSFSQPSIRKFMVNLDGITNGRPIGSRILCTDCHNSDDNREFGGPGPNGPHGSKWMHILERRYEFSQAPAPGQNITNPLQGLTPSNLGSIGGPFAMCAKCHDLTGSGILSASSFSGHASHIITDGFSCSVCHTAHGVAQTGSIPGVGLVNFDANVVSANGSGVPISYNSATNTCTLRCHGYDHNGDGTITPSALRGIGRTGVPVKSK